MQISHILHLQFLPGSLPSKAQEYVLAELVKMWTFNLWPVAQDCVQIAERPSMAVESLFEILLGCDDLRCHWIVD